MRTQNQEHTALLQALLEKPLMDDALFLNNVIQNVFVEVLPKLAISANERPAACKTSQSSSPSVLRQINQTTGILWISPLQWERCIKSLKEAHGLIIEHWDEVPESTRDRLIKTSEAILNSSPRRQPQGKQSNISFVRNRILLLSMRWASFVLKKDVLGELADAVDEFSREVSDKVDRIPGWNVSRTLVLSSKARDAFLKDVENPPDPPEALVAGMKDFWDQYSK